MDARALSNAGGSLTDSYSYKAFGEELAASGSTTNSLRYIGEYGYYRDASSRLYVRARHLNVGNGRWMSKDPIGFAGGDINLYRYAANQPIQKVDPTGNWVVLVPGGNGRASLDQLGAYLKSSKHEDCILVTYDYVSPFCAIVSLPDPFQPPNVGNVLDVLNQIEEKVAARRNINDYSTNNKCDIRMYGTSYGAHVVGQIANAVHPIVITLKSNIEKKYNVKFVRYVTSVGNACEYPEHFSKIHQNLYTLAGETVLESLELQQNPWEIESKWREGGLLICHLWWWNPLHYNTRQCFRETEGRFYVIPQRYWLPRDKDKIMQPWTTSDWYIDQHGDFNGDVGKGSNREPYIQAIRAKIKDLLF